MVAVSLPVPSTFTVRTVSRIDRIAADLRLLFFAEAPRGSLNVRFAPESDRMVASPRNDAMGQEATST